jgi:two-component system sensor histidine kinase ChiS
MPYSPTILLVDDIPTNLEVLLDFLSDSGFEVLVALDGASALEQAQYAQPDLILLDVMMPGMDGFETIRHLKAHEQLQAIPVIFMTALSDIVDKVKGFQLGAVDYITKPLQQEEVLARLNSHLTIRKLQQELQQMNLELEQRVIERTRELAESNHAYSRFVPKEFLQLLGQKRITDLQLGDQVQMDMTILFSDIRDFTSLSETMTPQQNFRFLNSYLGRVSPIIRQYGGFIDKYIGDGIMALFPRQADDGVQAAIAIQKTVLVYNDHRRAQGYQPIRVGTGIHSGSIMLGTIGETERMEGTVISDAVNLASRMEGLTKIYGANIVMSEQVLLRLQNSDHYNFRFLDHVLVKGKREPVSVFELFDGDEPPQQHLKDQTKSMFEEALMTYYDKDFVTAQQQLQAVLELNPHDSAAQLYLHRISHFIEHGFPVDWSGIESIHKS